jgi:RimJ/RimL family protein N-acetyltransferase
MPIIKSYRIETERLILRCYAPSDAPAMSEVILRNHAHLHPWMPWAVKDQHTIDFCEDLIRLFRGNFDLGIDQSMGIFLKDSGQYIGGCGLHPRVGPGAFEIGYWVDGAECNKGYAQEAAAGLTKAAFEFEGVHRMNIHMQIGNLPSEAIPPKLGYLKEGTLRQWFPLGEGKFADIHYFSMLREEYDAAALKAMPIKAFGFDGNELSPQPTL